MADTKNPAPNKTPKMVASEAPKSTPPKVKLLESKQARQSIVLILVVILIGIALYFTTIRSSGPEETDTGEIQTEFNTDQLETIRDRDQNYPEVQTDNLGKPNPFAN